MGDVDLRKLRVLREVSERGTVSGAAAALHLSPQAVSQQLSTLSRELGAQLTEPAGRRIVLTGAARIVLRHAETLFAELERMKAAVAAHLSGEVGEVSISGFSTTLSALILPAVVRMKETRPRLEAKVAEVDPPESFALLQRGQTDVVISADTTLEWAGGEGRFHLVPLCEDPFDIALPESHDLVGTDRLALSDFAADTWIFATTGMCHDIGVAACTAAGFTPQASHAIGDWEATLSAVQLDLGVALVPRLARLANRPGVRIRAFTDTPPRRQVFAAVRDGSQRSPEIAATLSALRSVAAEAVR